MASQASQTSQALDNFAKRPTQQKVAIFVGIGAMLGVAYWQLMLSPAQETRDSAQTSHARLLKDKEKLEGDLIEKKKLVRENDELQKVIEDNQRALPTESELPSLFDHLQRKAGEAGVTIKNWERKPEVPVETFMKVQVSIQLTGTFYQIEKYFALLAPVKAPVAATPAMTPAPTTPAPTTPGAAVAPAAPTAPAGGIEERIVSIENLTLDSPELRNEELYLTAKFIAATYRQAEEAAPAKPAPAAAKGGKVGNATKAAEDKVKAKTGDTSPDDEKPAAAAPADKSKAGVDRMKGVE